MCKVKIFQSDNYNKLEQDVNAWLKKRYCIIPIKFLQSQSHDKFDTTVTITAIYEDK